LWKKDVKQSMAIKASDQNEEKFGTNGWNLLG